MVGPGAHGKELAIGQNTPPRRRSDPSGAQGVQSGKRPLPFDPIAEAAVRWQGLWGPEGVPGMQASMSIIRVQQILLSRLNAMLEPFGLTLARYEALMLLYFSRRGTLPLGKMGSRLQVHPTSVTNLVDGLERAGLVRRQAHEYDRRTTLASITDVGREVGEAATVVLNTAHFGMDHLPPQELETITRTLATMRERSGDFESAGAQSETPVS